MSPQPRCRGFANQHLIGAADARGQLLTPALILDLDPFEANLARMQAIADKAGVVLRPHGKAHKCAEIARRQLAVGAVGICAATPGEAEAFAAEGIEDILVTSTFGTEAAAARLADIAAAGIRLTVVFDHPTPVQIFAAALERKGARARALIDIDLGRHRAGVASPEAACNLAQAISEAFCLDLGGVQAYAGHLSHCQSPARRREQAEEAGKILADMLHALAPWLPERPQVTGCSTGAMREELALGLYTEMQCGSYALMDAEYDLVDPDGSGQPVFATSLFVASSVISANHPGLATTDGGEKRFAAKHGTAPVIRRGAPEGAIYRPTSDEHGTITLPEASHLSLGTMVEVQVPHCDPTVNLYDAIHVMRGETLLAIWPVTARGA